MYGSAVVMGFLYGIPADTKYKVRRPDQYWHTKSGIKYSTQAYNPYGIQCNKYNLTITFNHLELKQEIHQ